MSARWSSAETCGRDDTLLLQILQTFAQDEGGLRRKRHEALCPLFEFGLCGTLAQPETEQIEDAVLKCAACECRRYHYSGRCFVGEMPREDAAQIVCDGRRVVVEEQVPGLGLPELQDEVDRDRKCARPDELLFGVAEREVRVSVFVGKAWQIQFVEFGTCEDREAVMRLYS